MKEIEQAELKKWINYFSNHHKVSESKSNFLKNEPLSSHQSACALGALWYEFSDFMPWFLSMAAASVSTNEMRQSLIQVAHEELGEGNKNQLHSEQFKKALSQAGIVFSHCSFTSEHIDYLKEKLLTVKSEYTVLGLCLGLEIIANENIESLIGKLSLTPKMSAALESSYFFKVHRVNEDQHIEYNIKNFLHFCSSEIEKEKFMQGFEEALDFWHQFWSKVASLEKTTLEASA